VPREAPELPTYDGHEPEKFKPSRQYLAMQKFLFWILLAIIDVLIVGGWIIIAIADPLIGGLLGDVAHRATAVMTLEPP
jgi:cytochrome b subunit of formate dehydrogenase